MRLLTFLLASLIANVSYGDDSDIVLNKIVAIINNGVVLASEVEAETSFLKQQAASSGQSLPADSVFEKRVIERLIDQEVQRQHASKLGISVDASSVNRAIEQIAGNNNMDVQQFRQSLQQEGLDYDRFRINVEQELLFNRLLQRDVQSRIKVSAQEIDDFIDSSSGAENQRYRVQHILIAVSPTANASDFDRAAERADTLLRELKAGADFSQTAISSSDGARALEGGDLGWRRLQELPDFLATALKTMEPGQLSAPLRSANGIHIVRLNEKRNGAQIDRTETLVRHIFLAANADDNTQAKIEFIRQRIENGEAFDVVARETSEDPNSASKGGELPWFGPGQMPIELEQMADSLEKGALSEVFRTQFGWHVLEVIDRRSGTSSEDELRQQAEQVIRQKKTEQETERWIRQLRDESFIEVRS